MSISGTSTLFPSTSHTYLSTDLIYTRGRMSLSPCPQRGIEEFVSYTTSRLKLWVIQYIRLPDNTMSSNIKKYMRSDFFDSKFLIPLWKPSQGLVSDDQQRHRNRVMRVGDVGYFNNEGGFEVLFNIFNTAQQNRENYFDPPANFTHYDSSPERKVVRSFPMRKDSYRPSSGDFRLAKGSSDPDSKYVVGLISFRSRI